MTPGNSASPVNQRWLQVGKCTRLGVPRYDRHELL
jgi:hypothetical protein